MRYTDVCPACRRKFENYTDIRANRVFCSVVCQFEPCQKVYDIDVNLNAMTPTPRCELPRGHEGDCGPLVREVKP